MTYEQSIGNRAEGQGIHKAVYCHQPTVNTHMSIARVALGCLPLPTVIRSHDLNPRPHSWLYWLSAIQATTGQVTEDVGIIAEFRRTFANWISAVSTLCVRLFQAGASPLQMFQLGPSVVF